MSQLKTMIFTLDILSETLEKNLEKSRENLEKGQLNI